MRLYYAGCADISAFDDDVFRRGASPCRPTFRRTCRARPDLCMSWFSWWRSSRSQAPLAASGLRNVALDRGLARRLAKPASTCALDCPPICRGKGATKPFRKPQSVLMSFPSARQLRGDKGLLHFGRIDSVRHQPLCGGTCIASDWRRPAGTRGRAGELFESSSRGAQQRGDAGVARRPAFPGLLRFARNDDAGSTQMQYALEAERIRSWKAGKAL